MSIIEEIPIQADLFDILLGDTVQHVHHSPFSANLDDLSSDGNASPLSTNPIQCPPMKPKKVKTSCTC